MSDDWRDDVKFTFFPLNEKFAGSWEIGHQVLINVREKTQTDEQIANVEKTFGWKWHDYSEDGK